MDSLLILDYELFWWINRDLSSSFLDAVLPILRNRYIWLPFYIWIIAYIFTSFKIEKASWYLLFLVSAICITDVASSRVMKNFVKRTRPCQEISLEGHVIERVRCNYSYSFTSSHATNHFGLAMILSILLFKRRWMRWALFSWAAVISFAQIYVGVHYPLDVLAGAMLGIALIRIYAGFITPTLDRINEEENVRELTV